MKRNFRRILNDGNIKQIIKHPFYFDWNCISYLMILIQSKIINDYFNSGRGKRIISYIN